MTAVYFKRHKMRVRLEECPQLNAYLKKSSAENHLRQDLPDGFKLVPWSPRLLNRHAEVKWQSFRNELDAHVFPCLGELNGCRQLMKEISTRRNFVPEATWLACCESHLSSGLQPCGTVQGLKASRREGAIQNLGVHEDCRDLGIGSVLLLQALHGFYQAGCQSVHLEVTVQNSAAIRLYKRFGFRHVETLFKAVEPQFA